MKIVDQINILKIVKAILKNEDDTLEANVKAFIDDVNDFESLVQVAADKISYGDVSELCETIGIDEYWFDDHFEFCTDDFYDRDNWDSGSW